MQPMRREVQSTLSLALPVVVAEIGWVAMQIVDIGMVGHLGPEAIGAVGVGSALFMVLGVFGMGLLLGLDPLVSQASGARDSLECERWLKHGLLLALLVAVPLIVAAMIGAKFIYLWGFDTHVLGQTTAYLKIITWSMLPLLLFAALRRYLQAINIVWPIMSTLITANAINGFTNWLLVFGNWGAPALGVEGAAWATCISRTYMLVALSLVAFVHITDPKGWWANGAGIELACLRRLLGLGWPAAVQTTLEFGVFAAVTVRAARLEPHSLAAHQIVANLVGLTFMVPLGLSAAGAVRVGQAVGRRDALGAQRAGWLTLGLGAVFMSLAAVAFITVPGPILRLFTVDPGILEVGAFLLLLAAVFQLFDGLQVVATGILRGLGDTRTAMMSSLAGHWCLGLPVGYFLCFSRGTGVVGLWVGLSIGLVLVGVFLVPVWHRRVAQLPNKLCDPASVVATA